MSLSKIFNAVPSFNKNEIHINQTYTRFIQSTRKSLDNLDKPEDCNIILSKMHTDDFINRLVNKINGKNQKNLILPKNCRFIDRKTDGRITVVIEDPPALRTVNININLISEIEHLKEKGLLSEYGYDDFFEKYTSEPPYQMQLSFPYIIYIIYFTKENYFLGMNMFYRLHPLSGTDDYLLITNLLNVSPDNGTVCIGVDYEKHRKIEHTICARTENIIDQFWTNEFNDDITSSYLLYKDNPYISTLLAWKYFSKTDPMFLFSVDWKRANNNLDFYIGQNRGLNAADFIHDLSQIINNGVISNDNHVSSTNRKYYCGAISLTKNGEKGNEYLHIGDELMLDGNKYYVYETFIANGENWVTLEDETGKTKDIKITSEIKETWRNEIQSKKEIKTLEIDGQEIKEGTYLQQYTEYENDLIRMIKKIRKTRDGKIEILCNDHYYCISDGLSMKGLKIFNPKDITFKGIKFTDDDYGHIIIHFTENPIFDVNIVKFDKFMVPDTFYFKIIMGGGNRSTITLKRNDDVIIYPIDREKIEEPHPIVRFGSLLLPNYNKNYKFYVFKNIGIGSDSQSTKVITSSNYIYPKDLIKPRRKHIEQFILKDNQLNIPSYDIDISFSVGDKVVIADYSKTAKFITTVRTITRFRFDHDDNLFVDTVDDENNVFSVPYIIMRIERLPIIRAGIIRKIYETDKLKGVKVRSKLAHIPMFKKKDTHETVGIISDTGTHSILLCSNGHTIWNVNKILEKYEFIDKKSRLYNKLEVTDNNKLPISKYQSGDLLDSYNPDLTNSNNYTDDRIIVSTWLGSSSLKFVLHRSSLCFYSRNRVYPNDYEHLRYQTIPMPRQNIYSTIKKEQYGSLNFHGWVNFLPLPSMSRKPSLMYNVCMEDIDNV